MQYFTGLAQTKYEPLKAAMCARASYESKIGDYT
jgi:hypothetical protein